MTQVMITKNTEVMTEEMEPAEDKEETERVVLENSMMDKHQTNSTRRRMLIPLRQMREPQLKSKRSLRRKRRNTKRSSLVFHSMIS